MAGLQNLTNENQALSNTAGQNVNPKPLSPGQDYYLTFVAAHGLSVEEDGQYTRITAQQFADSISVSRQTLYDWQKSIPDFWQLVDVRSREIWHQNTKHAIIRGLKLRALKGDAKQAEMLWSHFGDYVPPTQKHDIKISGMSELADLARKKKGQIDATD